MKPGAQILQTLCGAWMLRRDIHPEGARLHGDAIFAPAGEDALAYRESGILTLADGAEFSAYRQYRYRLSEDRIVVEFADGADIGKQFLSLSFPGRIADGKRVTSMSVGMTPTMRLTGFWGRRPSK